MSTAIHVCLVSLVVLCLQSSSGAIIGCTKQSSCSCMSENGLIDLSPLKGNPKFKDVTSDTGAQFSWNPCTPFTEGACTDVAACQIQGGNSYFSIGTQDSARFEVKSGTLQLSYSADTLSGNLTFLRTTIITLVCDETEDGQLIANGENPPASGKYLMTLTSKYVCTTPPTTTTTTTSTVSSPTTLPTTLVFTSMTNIYILLGVIVTLLAVILLMQIIAQVNRGSLCHMSIEKF